MSRSAFGIMKMASCLNDAKEGRTCLAGLEKVIDSIETFDLMQGDEVNCAGQGLSPTFDRRDLWAVHWALVPIGWVWVKISIHPESGIGDRRF